MCDMVPHHTVPSGTAWDSLASLAPCQGREALLRLGREDQFGHRALPGARCYRASTQSEAAEGPASSGDALCAVLPAVPFPARVMGEASQPNFFAALNI